MRFSLRVLRALHFAIMMLVMNIETWLDHLIGDDTRAVAAKNAGYAQSTISRQLARGHLRPETVIALCRVYGRSPVQGLVECGYIHAYEVDAPSVAVALEKATNTQILAEINRRSDPEARYLFTNDLDKDVVDVDEDAVLPFPTRDVSTPGGSLDDGTVPNFDEVYSPGEYAADSSPDETEERLKRGEDFID